MEKNSLTKLSKKIFILIMTLLVSWGLWVTNGIFKADKRQELSDKTIQTLSQDINQLHIDTKEIKKELKEQRDLIHNNQEKILEKLGDISKVLKRHDR